MTAAKEQYTVLQRVEYSINTLNHVFIGFVAIYMSWVCIKAGFVGLALHAWLCTIGYNLLMAEAIIAHYRGNVLTLTYSRKMKTTIHWVFQTIACTLCIGGISYEIYRKTRDGRVHFRNIHTRLGLASLVLCCLSLISGLSALYSQTLKKLLQPLLNKYVHYIIGLATFVVGMVTIFYGYHTYPFMEREQVPEEMLTLLSVLTLSTCVFSSIGPLLSIYEKFKTFFNID